MSMFDVSVDNSDSNLTIFHLRYRYGMVRALGMKHTSLVQLLLIQSLMYAIPGIILGLLMAYVLSLPVLFGIFYYSATPPEYTFASTAFWFVYSYRNYRKRSLTSE